MARQYAFALSDMAVRDVSIISIGSEQARKICNEFGFQALAGGYESRLPTLEKQDLVIVVTPIHLLLPATRLAIECGQDNILVEKPGSIYRQELESLARQVRKGRKRVRIAYNRVLYPNLHKLRELVQKEGGITSCRFTFTEWIHTIDFRKEKPDTYSRWGIANSLHVIAMAFALIGMPKKISCSQLGSGLDWHPSGSIFMGSGLTETGVPFSYHSDWRSAGRWSIEVMTRSNAYRLMPLEELHVCKVGSTEWKKVHFDLAFPKVKQGVAEQLCVMFRNDLEQKVGGLVSLEQAAAFNKVAEQIFGYD